MLGGELAATYLAGLTTSSTHEVASSAPMPAWARGFELAAMPTLGGELATRAVPELDMAYVAPDAFGDATVDTSPVSADATTESMPVQVAQAQAQAIAQQQREIVSLEAASSSDTIRQQQQQLTTLRSALLSWTVDDRGTISSPSATSLGTATATSSATATPTMAQLAMQSSSRPDFSRCAMLGDVLGSDSQMTWGAPGMIGSRAHAWSVAQERSTTDLALDFVSPELVLAARVYGFGPAEAIQAARLAIAGPTQLTAMAGAVDRTFVQAMAVEVERQRAAIQTAYPDATGAVRVVPRQAPGMPVIASQDAGGFEAGVAPSMTATTTQSQFQQQPAAGFMPSTSAFGIERRSPRGARSSWPSAAVAALGVHAPTPDSNLGMTVAALELLAAQAVAELGTYASLHPAFAQQREELADDTTTSTPAIDMRRRSPARPARRRPRSVRRSPRSSSRVTRRPSSSNRMRPKPTCSAPSPRWCRRLAARASMRSTWRSVSRSRAVSGRRPPVPRAPSRSSVAAMRRLIRARSSRRTSAPRRCGTSSRSSTRSASAAPTARRPRSRRPAACRRRRRSRRRRSSSRAASRAPGQRASCRRRRARPTSPSTVARGCPRCRRAPARRSARTVTPLGASQVISSSAASRDVDPASLGAVHRVPTAAPELVRTGSSRPQGRHGGGETEIPDWFEAAAKKMLGDAGNAQQGMGSDISLAELTC